MSGAPAAPEVVVARLRPHARALFWPSLLLVVVVGLVAYFADNLPEPWLEQLVLAGGGVALLVGVVLPMLAWAARSYTITSRRLVIRSGLLSRTRQEVLHSRGFDVTVRQSGIQLLFGSGDVLVDIGSGRPLLLRDVPHASLVQSALHDLIEEGQASLAERRRRLELDD